MSAWMLCQDCLAVRPYDEAGHAEEYRCHCGGAWCGCDSCNTDASRMIADLAPLDPKARAAFLSHGWTINGLGVAV